MHEGNHSFIVCACPGWLRLGGFLQALLSAATANLDHLGASRSFATIQYPATNADSVVRSPTITLLSALR
jgi:hypothetical protein